MAFIRDSDHAGLASVCTYEHKGGAWLALSMVPAALQILAHGWMDGYTYH